MARWGWIHLEIGRGESREQVTGVVAMTEKVKRQPGKGPAAPANGVKQIGAVIRPAGRKSGSTLSGAAGI